MIRPTLLSLPILLVLACVDKEAPIDTAPPAPIDDDGDGYSVEDGDCDDNDGGISPNAVEICDGIDNNCDGVIDEDVTTTYYADTDGDGFGDDTSSTESCEIPSGYSAVGGDCDDAEAESYPGNLEVCDGIDNNCDGSIDEDLLISFYADNDGDGYGDDGDMVESCDAPSGYVETSGDCDDADSAYNPAAEEFCNDPNDYNCDGKTGYADDDGDGFAACDECDDNDPDVNPDATELCDDIDNDCDGEIDEDAAENTQVWYKDFDGDNYGNPDRTTEACEQPSGYVADNTDCDDSSSNNNPSATEYCDDEDNDCDGTIDEDDAADAPTWYEDYDGDSFGDASRSTNACDQPTGYVADDTDCNDNNSSINPDGTEICDSADNDCDGDIDEDDAIDALTWYADSDGDSYGDIDATTEACNQPSGYVADDTDCDDSNNTQYPGADEYCNEEDDDCDGEIDESGALDEPTWYADSDTDSYGDPDATTDACEQPSGYVADSSDCDDGDSAQYPGADEYCNEEDDDCDGTVDENTALDASTWYGDADGDSFGNSDFTLVECEQPSNYVDNSDDCDDTDSAVNPDAQEICNGYDDDCDEQIDDDDDSVDLSTGTTWYADTDGDTYGDLDSTTESCDVTEGYVGNADDCDDTDSAINPAATEICDDIDNDCDSLIDDDDSSVDTSTGTTYYEDDDGDTYGDPADTTDACDTPDGYVDNSDDCDDTDSAVNPDAQEICNEYDDDCDGDVDDDDDSLDSSTGTVWYADDDNDTYGNIDDTIETCDRPNGYTTDTQDCDDTDSAVNPAATEVCNEYDDDCDGLIDDDDNDLDSSTGTVWYADDDNDTYGNIDDTVETCDMPSGYTTDTQDCDDTDSAISPSATEICDEIDNDCDSLIDDDDGSLDSSTGTVWYADDDNDTYGNLSDTVETCDMPSGYTTDTQDCDDTDSAINPDAQEICDDVDNDCDSLIDDADDSNDGSTGSTYYADDDNDTYGDPDNTTDACGTPAGYTSDSTDCDDTDSAINPGATEVCNEYDDDCDSLIDDDDGSLDSSTGTVWYADDDSDTYGDASSTTMTCDLPSGYVADSTDCDDGDNAQYPGADEYCNSEDDDCDGTTDEDALDGSWWYVDNDNDSFGDPDNEEWACDGVSNAYDCDDSDTGDPIVVDGVLGSSAGDGSASSPLDTIQAGIDASDECVIVYNGTYTESIDFNGADISLTGVDGSEATVIDGSGTGEPVISLMNSEDATIEGFTLINGEGYLEETSSSYACTSIITCTDYYDSYAGGGLYIDGATVSIYDLIIESNSLPAASTTTSGDDTYYVNSYGGGIHVANGILTGQYVELTENYADQGGGLYADSSSVVTLNSSWLNANTAGDGAGVEIDGGELSMTNVVSIWNAAASEGGGVFGIDATLTLTNVTLGGDDAPTGGGLYASGSTAATVMNTIIVDAGTGEGVLVDGSASFSGSYNDVFGNTGGNYSGLTDPTGTSGNISSDPLFSDWTDNGDWTDDDLSLSSSSPALNAGNPSSSYNDADGTANDMGAWGGPGSDW